MSTTTDEEESTDAINQNLWIDTVRGFTDKELRQYLDLITLSCILLASKMNE